MARGSTRFTADDLRVGARFFSDLPRFLRTPLTPAQSRARVKERMTGRAASLVAFVGDVFDRPASPYAMLLRHVGLAPADVASMVAREGVEGTLAVLLREGVYLTVDEFKGRRPVVRGSLEFTIDRTGIVNPRSVVHGVAETSGSGGSPMPVPIDLASIADHAVNTQLAMAAYGGEAWSHAHYGAPGGTAITNPLELAKGGTPPARWFTPIALRAPGLGARFRLGSLVLRLGSALAGVPLPGPTLAPFADPTPIVRWLEGELRAGRTPHVWTLVSSAVIVCQAALERGCDLRGARFTAGGEPTTAARRAAIEAVGAIVLPRMGTTETDIVSYACTAPTAPDDMHFFEDRLAVVQPGAGVEGVSLPPDALLLTTLLSTAPLQLLNVSLGDQARLERRACGCGLEREGWTLHLRQVRSFEKLVAGGVTLLDVDVDRVLEEVLPARFGGLPTDYQLLERLDGAGGRPEVTLLAHPALGALDESALADAFLEAIGNGAGGDRMTELLWRGAGVLKVERQAPRRTASGKILHLHHDVAGAADRTSRAAAE